MHEWVFHGTRLHRGVTSRKEVTEVMTVLMRVPVTIQPISQFTRLAIEELVRFYFQIQKDACSIKSESLVLPEPSPYFSNRVEDFATKSTAVKVFLKVVCVGLVYVFPPFIGFDLFYLRTRVNSDFSFCQESLGIFGFSGVVLD